MLYHLEWSKAGQHSDFQFILVLENSPGRLSPKKPCVNVQARHCVDFPGACLGVEQKGWFLI